MSRQYFDLDVAGQNGTFSMARRLAAGGDLVVIVDPPGVGESDAPDDGYTLTPRVVAEVLTAALDGLRAELGATAWLLRDCPVSFPGPWSGSGTLPGPCWSPTSRRTTTHTMSSRYSASPRRDFPAS